MAIIVPYYGVDSQKKITFALLIYVYRIMKNLGVVILAMFAVCSVTATVWSPDNRKRVDDIDDMLLRGRWADAQILLDDLRSRLDPVKDHYDLEWVDYHSVRCAVNMGAANAEELMTGFMESYPSSVHANRMRFMLGSYHCDNGDFELAETEFSEVDYEALDARERERYDIRMGYIRFVQNDYLTARQRFSRIKRSSEYYNHALYYLSYINYVTGNYNEARKGLTELKGVHRYEKVVPFYLLQIEYREGNYKGVIEQGTPLLECAEASVYNDLARIIAESYFKLNDYVQANHYISKLPEEAMGRRENYIRGYSLYRSAQYVAAIEPLVKVCGQNDALTQNASYHLGDCYLRSGDKERAAKAFAMAATEDFSQTNAEEGEAYNPQIAEDALLNYGKLRYELGGDIFNESVNVLQSYLERYPDSPHTSEVKSLLIAAYYNSENYDAAYTTIKSYSGNDPEIRAALQKVALQKAVKSIGEGNIVDAKSLLDESLEIGLTSKYNALTLFWQGEVASLENDADRAVECYTAYLRRAPESASEYNMAKYGLGYAYFRQNNMNDAIASLQEFVRAYIHRDNYLYDAQNRLGDAHFSLRQFSDARKAYNVVVSSPSPDRNYARYRVAMIDGVESKNKSKISTLKDIIDDGSGDYVDDAWFELGRTYINMEKYADGAATLQEFVESEPQSPFYIRALSDLGLAYYNLNRKDDARSCYEKVVEYDPQSSAALEAMRSVREIYVDEGRVDEYFAYAERCGVQSDMSAAARDSLTFAVAKTSYLDGHMNEAAFKLQNYLNSFEAGYNRSEALFYLSDCHLQSGEKQKAMEAMTELLNHGRSQYTERVLTVLAPLSFDEKDFVKSAKSYRDLYDVATTKGVRTMALDGYVEATLKLNDDDKTIAMADDIANLGDASAWAIRTSLLAKAYVLVERADSASAMEIFSHLSTQRGTVEGAEAYYRLIEAQYNNANYDVAEQMVYDYGDSGSMYWQAKAFLLLGDIMVKKNNLFQARATYQSIVDGYSPSDDGIIDEAKARINALK